MVQVSLEKIYVMKFLFTLLLCFLLTAPLIAQKNRAKSNANANAANVQTQFSPTPMVEPTARAGSESDFSGMYRYAVNAFHRLPNYQR